MTRGRRRGPGAHISSIVGPTATRKRASGGCTAGSKSYCAPALGFDHVHASCVRSEWHLHGVCLNDLIRPMFESYFSRPLLESGNRPSIGSP